MGRELGPVGGQLEVFYLSLRYHWFEKNAILYRRFTAWRSGESKFENSNKTISAKYKVDELALHMAFIGGTAKGRQS